MKGGDKERVYEETETETETDIIKIYYYICCCGVAAKHAAASRAATVSILSPFNLSLFYNVRICLCSAAAAAAAADSSRATPPFCLYNNGYKHCKQKQKII